MSAISLSHIEIPVYSGRQEYITNANETLRLIDRESIEIKFNNSIQGKEGRRDVG